MLEIHEALSRIMPHAKRAPTRSVALLDALGCVLAESVEAAVDVPPWDNSAMDGYAVLAADLLQGEASLKLLETIAAGRAPSETVISGCASAIMTGAPMPPGADAVVMVEKSDGATSGSVRLTDQPTSGQNVRRRGTDVARGAVVAASGERLRPEHLGLIASVGVGEVVVSRPPRVAIVSTGDELTEPGMPLPPGGIYASNGVMLAGLIQEAGGDPWLLPTAADDLSETIDLFQRAVAGADVVVSTGGVSVGRFDFVKEAQAAVGAEMGFWKVRMKPGKPLAFGVAPPNTPLFGLPGNPVSCVVNFYQFVRPFLRKMLGDARAFLPIRDAVAGQDFSDRPGRARLMRVCLEERDGRLIATSAGSQSSGVLSAMAHAQGLLIVAPDDPSPKCGDPVRVQLTAPERGQAEPGYGFG